MGVEEGAQEAREEAGPRVEDKAQEEGSREPVQGQEGRAGQVKRGAPPSLCTSARHSRCGSSGSLSRPALRIEPSGRRWRPHE